MTATSQFPLIFGANGGRPLRCAPDVYPVYQELIKARARGNHWARLIIKELASVSVGRLLKYSSRSKPLASGAKRHVLSLPSRTGCTTARTLTRCLCAVFLALLGGCTSASEASCAGKPLEHYFGTYSVERVESYRGGLTSAEQAQQRIGEKVVIGTERLVSNFAAIDIPRYIIACYPNAAAEGEVPTQRWSNFYGLGVDRDSIDVLMVYAEGDPENEPSYYFEIVEAGLWELFDGWVYYLTPET